MAKDKAGQLDADAENKRLISSALDAELTKSVFTAPDGLTKSTSTRTDDYGDYEIDDELEHAMFAIDVPGGQEGGTAADKLLTDPAASRSPTSETAVQKAAVQNTAASNISGKPQAAVVAAALKAPSTTLQKPQAVQRLPTSGTTTQQHATSVTSGSSATPKTDMISGGVAKPVLQKPQAIQKLPASSVPTKRPALEDLTRSTATGSLSMPMSSVTKPLPQKSAREKVATFSISRQVTGGVPAGSTVPGFLNTAVQTTLNDEYDADADLEAAMLSSYGDLDNTVGSTGQADPNAPQDRAVTSGKASFDAPPISKTPVPSPSRTPLPRSTGQADPNAPQDRAVTSGKASFDAPPISKTPVPSPSRTPLPASPDITVLSSRPATFVAPETEVRAAPKLRSKTLAAPNTIASTRPRCTPCIERNRECDRRLPCSGCAEDRIRCQYSYSSQPKAKSNSQHVGPAKVVATKIFRLSDVKLDASGTTPVVYYCTSSAQADNIAQLFSHEGIIGFDIEYLAFAPPLKATDGVSLIQLASRDKIALFHLVLYGTQSPGQLITPALKAIIEDLRVAKVGNNIGGDMTRILRWLQVKALNVQDTMKLSKRWAPDLIDDKLATQFEFLFDMELHKGDVRTGDWSKRLTPEQQHYAAADAYASRMVYEEWLKRKADGRTLRVDPDSKLHKNRKVTKPSKAKGQASLKSNATGQASIKSNATGQASIQSNATGQAYIKSSLKLSRLPPRSMGLSRLLAEDGAIVTGSALDMDLCCTNVKAPDQGHDLLQVAGALQGSYAERNAKLDRLSTVFDYDIIPCPARCGLRFCSFADAQRHYESVYDTVTHIAGCLWDHECGAAIPCGSPTHIELHEIAGSDFECVCGRAFCNEYALALHLNSGGCGRQEAHDIYTLERLIRLPTTGIPVPFSGMGSDVAILHYKKTIVQSWSYPAAPTDDHFGIMLDRYSKNEVSLTDLTVRANEAAAMFLPILSKQSVRVHSASNCKTSCTPSKLEWREDRLAMSQTFGRWSHGGHVMSMLFTERFIYDLRRCADPVPLVGVNGGDGFTCQVSRLVRFLDEERDFRLVIRFNTKSDGLSVPLIPHLHCISDGNYCGTIKTKRFVEVFRGLTEDPWLSDVITYFDKKQSKKDDGGWATGRHSHVATGHGDFAALQQQFDGAEEGYLSDPGYSSLDEQSS
ncbi:hypothetical protein LTR17_014404 [Elasticomyces elasticus]|nr:hypothetical protein LTR17_014404 [Elasticomyces elasticus]